MAQRIYPLVMPMENNEVFLDLPEDRRVIGVEKMADGVLVRIWIEQEIKV